MSYWGAQNCRVNLCKTCGNPVPPPRWVFCSRRCRNRNTNLHHQAYVRQHERGRLRKLYLIREMGGACQRCGYMKNHAALAFHHVRPESKSFQLDLRALSNRTWERVIEEITKCELLCNNCHCELHHPECALTPQQIEQAFTLPKRRKYVHKPKEFSASTPRQ
jgi:hypothetical protein